MHNNVDGFDISQRCLTGAGIDGALLVEKIGILQISTLELQISLRQVTAIFHSLTVGGNMSQMERRIAGPFLINGKVRILP